MEITGHEQTAVGAILDRMGIGGNLASRPNYWGGEFFKGIELYAVNRDDIVRVFGREGEDEFVSRRRCLDRLGTEVGNRMVWAGHTDDLLFLEVWLGGQTS